ncbi:hypothetical protein OC834_007788 [Tilletia horrida]|nr:hypothetical protein OC834_007788 [Tilletia horrida]
MESDRAPSPASAGMPGEAAFMALVQQQLQTWQLLYEPTASQQCINMLDERVRGPVWSAYRAVRATFKDGRRPDFKAVKETYLSCAPEEVSDKILEELGKFFSDAALESALAAMDDTAADHDVGERLLTPSNALQPSTRGNLSVLTNAASGNVLTNAASGACMKAGASTHVSGATCTLPATLSRPAGKAVAGARRGQAQRWIYNGVFRWEHGAVSGQPLREDEIMAEARKAGLSGSAGTRQPEPAQRRGTPSASEATKKGKAKAKSTLRAERPERLKHLREQWVCSLCPLVVRNEKVGITSNLAKHYREDHKDGINPDLVEEQDEVAS